MPTHVLFIHFVRWNGSSCSFARHFVQPHSSTAEIGFKYNNFCLIFVCYFQLFFSRVVGFTACEIAHQICRHTESFISYHAYFQLLFAIVSLKNNVSDILFISLSPSYVRECWPWMCQNCDQPTAIINFWCCECVSDFWKCFSHSSIPTPLLLPLLCFLRLFI